MKRATSKKKTSHLIEHLKKDTFDVSYSLRHKYPACVVESFDGLRDVGIDRNSVNEPFRPDPAVPMNALDNYRQYMHHGGRMVTMPRGILRVVSRVNLAN